MRGWIPPLVRRQQPGSPIYTKDYDAAGVRHGLSEAKRERTPDWSGPQQSPGTFEGPAFEVSA
jgi:hypothetical protein